MGKACFREEWTTNSLGKSVGRRDRGRVAAYGNKSCVADLQQVRIWTIRNVSRPIDLGVVKPLQTVEQHRTVLLIQNVMADFDDPVRAYGNEVLVVRGVMQLAEGLPIWHARISPFLVRNDVSGIEEFAMPQTANRALSLVRTQDSLTK